MAGKRGQGPGFGAGGWEGGHLGFGFGGGSFRGRGEAIVWEKRRRNWPEKGTRDQDCARGDGTVVIWDSDLGLIPLCGGEEIFNARGGGRNGAAHSQVSKARPGARCEKRTGRWRVVLSQVRKSGPGAPNHQIGRASCRE